MSVTVQRAKNGIHKFTAVFPDGAKVHFGRQGYSDYTKHGDRERMERYLTRHRRRENWTRSGAKTAGFWSRWLLWSSPSLTGAKRRTEKVLGKKIVLK
jgi:hypothetical protein